MLPRARIPIRGSGTPGDGHDARTSIDGAYRDFLAGGGLDIVGASRSPGRSPQPRQKDQDR
ncbi:MAG: hypothetical protein ACREX8_14415 [Gammaproteobacteria bacterium]